MLVVAFITERVGCRVYVSREFPQLFKGRVVALS